MNPLTADMGRLYQRLHQSQTLEKVASALSEAEATDVLAQKAALDNTTFELAKTAGLQMLANAGQRLVSSPFGKGMAMAAGAAIPATIAANAITSHAAEAAKTKALETAGGLAQIGSTLYGLHQQAQQQPKMAAELDETLKKLASVGYLDTMLEVSLEDPALSAVGKKMASEMLSLNREYGVDLLRQLTEI